DQALVELDVERLDLGEHVLHRPADDRLLVLVGGLRTLGLLLGLQRLLLLLGPVPLTLPEARASTCHISSVPDAVGPPAQRRRPVRWFRVRRPERSAPP